MRLLSTLSLMTLLCASAANATQHPPESGHVRITSPAGLLLAQPIRDGREPAVFRVVNATYAVQMTAMRDSETGEGVLFGSCQQRTTQGTGNRHVPYVQKTQGYPIRWRGAIAAGQRTLARGCPGMLIQVDWP